MAICYIVQKLKDIVRSGAGRANSVSDYNCWWHSSQSSFIYSLTIPNIPGVQKVEWEGNFFFDQGDYKYNYTGSCILRKGDTILAQGVGNSALSASAGTTISVGIAISVSMKPPGSTRGVSPMSVTYDKMRIITTVELPTISEMQYASEVNRLAQILNVSTTNPSVEIAKLVMSNIGTAIGNMTTSWNGTEKATAVSFTSSEAVKSEVNACITNMTGNFVQRGITNYN